MSPGHQHKAQVVIRIAVLGIQAKAGTELLLSHVQLLLDVVADAQIEVNEAGAGVKTKRVLECRKRLGKFLLLGVDEAAVPVSCGRRAISSAGCR